MKKLMIAVAIVCAAAFAQAATYSWQSGDILDHNKQAFASGGVTGYLFTIDSDDYSTYAALTSENLTKTLWADYGAKLSSAATSKSSGATGKANISYGTAVANTPAYAAVIYVDNNSTPQYVMGNVAEINWAGTGAAQASNLGLYKTGGTSGTATSWQTVPEPTSGLLLLLGVAGLALRRRHA